MSSFLRSLVGKPLDVRVVALELDEPVGRAHISNLQAPVHVDEAGPGLRLSGVGWPLDKLLDQLASPDVKRRRKAAQETVETT